MISFFLLFRWAAAGCRTRLCYHRTERASGVARGAGKRSAKLVDHATRGILLRRGLSGDASASGARDWAHLARGASTIPSQLGRNVQYIHSYESDCDERVTLGRNNASQRRFASPRPHGALGTALHELTLHPYKTSPTPPPQPLTTGWSRRRCSQFVCPGSIRGKGVHDCRAPLAAAPLSGAASRQRAAALLRQRRRRLPFPQIAMGVAGRVRGARRRSTKSA